MRARVCVWKQYTDQDIDSQLPQGSSMPSPSPEDSHYSDLYHQVFFFLPFIEMESYSMY